MRLNKRTAGLTDVNVFNRRLLVHHFYISSPESIPEMIQCSCSAYFGISKHSEKLSHAQHQLRYGISQWLESSNTGDLSSQMAQLSTSDYVPDYYGNSGIPVQQPYQTQQAAAGYTVPNASSGLYREPGSGQYQRDIYQCQYQTNEDGLPVNTANGTVRAVRLAIHIANLSRKTTKKQLASLLKRKRIATPVQVDFHLDSDSEKFKGVAVVHFQTGEDAKHARETLDNYNWDGRRLRVKLDRNSIPLDTNDSANQPMVLNGSTGY
jgi:RNA recognition motif-containing protein